MLLEKLQGVHRLDHERDQQGAKVSGVELYAAFETACGWPESVAVAGH
jgi:hypothetical protein